MTLSIKTQFCSTLPINKKDVLKGIIRFHYLTTCPCSMTKNGSPRVMRCFAKPNLLISPFFLNICFLIYAHYREDTYDK